jgi:hypothetical protein
VAVDVPGADALDVAEADADAEADDDPPNDRRFDVDDDGSAAPEKKTLPDGMGALPLPRPPCPDRECDDDDGSSA